MQKPKISRDGPSPSSKLCNALYGMMQLKTNINVISTCRIGDKSIQCARFYYMHWQWQWPNVIFYKQRWHKLASIQTGSACTLLLKLDQNWKLKIKTYLVEHLLEVIFGTDPRCYSVTEEDEIAYDSIWVHVDHYADPAKRRVLLLIVTDVSQWCTPESRHHITLSKWLQTSYSG